VGPSLTQIYINDVSPKYNFLKKNTLFNFKVFYKMSERVNLISSKYPNLGNLVYYRDLTTSSQVFYTKWVEGSYIDFIGNNSKNQNSGLAFFSNSNVMKFIDLLSLNSYNMQFLRRSKIFNKGRYSRNRQFYRTGVY